MSHPIHVITHIYVQPGKEAEAKTLLKELVAVTRAESGCLRYELLQNRVVPTEFVLVEEWQSEEVFNAHKTAPQVEEAMLEGAPFLTSPPDIRRYELVM